MVDRQKIISAAKRALKNGLGPGMHEWKGSRYTARHEMHGMEKRSTVIKDTETQKVYQVDLDMSSCSTDDPRAFVGGENWDGVDQNRKECVPKWQVKQL